jgi:hypothetical protein
VTLIPGAPFDHALQASGALKYRIRMLDGYKGWDDNARKTMFQRQDIEMQARERKHPLMQASLREYRHQLERTTTQISQLSYANQVYLWNLEGFRIHAWHACEGGLGAGLQKRWP